MTEENQDKYYIELKSNNEFQIRHFHYYDDQKPQESMEKVNNYLKSKGGKGIPINAFNNYNEATKVLDKIVPYTNDGINVYYELRKYVQQFMTEEEKDELNKIINNYITEKAFKRFNAASFEGLKIKLNNAIKKEEK